MPKVLVTGMSGTGKSAALQMLGERGHRVVDTDTDQWSHWVTLPDGSPDWIWREDAIAALLASHQHGHLFVAGCKTRESSTPSSTTSRRSARPPTPSWPGSGHGPAIHMGNTPADEPRSCCTSPR